MRHSIIIPENFSLFFLAIRENEIINVIAADRKVLQADWDRKCIMIFLFLSFALRILG
jgi:hypothetical protein